ncbi:MAG: TrmH family RNA methyltransferase [Planctomycetota bacterium]|jgi:TrmH family RNA methyltransferase
MGANPLDNIAIVLVEPKGPLNVGSAARAMKNMGLNQMIVVGSMDLKSDECRLMAPGSADILDHAIQVSTLTEALADRTLVIGTTARERHRTETMTPRDVAPEILDTAATSKVAILFGREDFGLFKEELALCHRVLSVPTSEDRASINLAQAVLLVSYELFQQSTERAVTASSDFGDLIVGEHWQRLYSEVLTCCAETGYLHAGNKLAIESSIRRLLKLGPIQTRDARHLYGLVRRVAKMIAGRAEPNRQQEFYSRDTPNTEGKD